MGRKAASKNWGHSNAAVKRFAAAMQEARDNAPEEERWKLTNFVLPLCDWDCNYLLPSCNRRRIAPCKDKNNHPDQVVISDPFQKGRIPRGLAWVQRDAGTARDTAHFAFSLWC